MNVNMSSDQGVTWTAAAVVDVGPRAPTRSGSPSVPTRRIPSRDNVYVSWTHFNDVGGSEIWFTRSTDGGNALEPRRGSSPPWTTA